MYYGQILVFFYRYTLFDITWKFKSRHPEVEKKIPDPERVNPEIQSLKTPDPRVPIKVLPPHLLHHSVFIKMIGDLDLFYNAVKKRNVLNSYFKVHLLFTGGHTVGQRAGHMTDREVETGLLRIFVSLIINSFCRFQSEMIFNLS